MDIALLTVDAEAISEGQWVNEIPRLGDVRLRVRGLTSPEVESLRARKLRAVPTNERSRDGMPNHAAMTRITGEVLYEAVLLDWDGIVQDGKPVPYSKELAREWLTNPRFRKFADAVAQAATFVDNGEAEATEALAGN